MSMAARASAPAAPPADDLRAMIDLQQKRIEELELRLTRSGKPAE
jgi:hypothetical protein